MSSKLAQRQLNEFKVRCGEYGDEALHLAYHAALPVALNPELLHFLRINFFLDPPNQLPFTVEFELLTGLCREIDTELYEIEPEIRDELLRELIREYGFQRIQDVASLLWEYIEYHSPWTERVELERAQQLTVLNFLDSAKAKQWLDTAEANTNQGMGGEREWFIAMRQEIEQIDEISDEEKAFIGQIQIQYLRQHLSQEYLKVDTLFEVIKKAGFNPNEDLVGANLSGVNNLAGSDIRGVNLNGADLEEANLSDANLSGVDLSNAKIRFANLNRANLEGANLSNALLFNSNLQNTNLRNANLSGADLQQALLLDVDLKSANLTDADMRDANLSNADLKGANLTEVNLSGAIVDNAQFGQNTGLSEEIQLDLIQRGAIIFEGTTVYPIYDQWGEATYGELISPQDDLSSEKGVATMQLQGKQFKKLQEALSSAFPNLFKLKQMVKFQLGKRLEEIAGGENYYEVLFNLIEWAESEGKVLELITGAYQQNPNNPELKAFCQQLCQNDAVDSAELSRFCQQLLEAPKDTPFIDATIKPDDLISNQGVDYTHLRDLLVAANWKEADQETLAVMVKIAGREQEGYLDIESINHFPCEDLRKIDQLWVKYSKGHFGFSVQKRIWQYSEVNSDLIRFIIRVGWGWAEPEKSLVVFKGINLLSFDFSAPPGQLPVAVTYNHPPGQDTRTKMMSRIIECNL